jgi:hypothetical protein
MSHLNKEKNEDDEEKKLVKNPDYDDHLMGRIVTFRIPISSKICSLTYCQIFQLILGFV